MKPKKILHKTFSYIAIISTLLTMQLIPIRAIAQRPVHLKFAEKVLKNIDPYENQYASKPSKLELIIEEGLMIAKARTVCATFITNILQNSYLLEKQDMIAWTGSSSPNSEAYYNLINFENGFKRITNIEDIKPGNFLVYKNPKNSSYSSSGHIAIISSVPNEKISTAPVVENALQWEVEVIDSSKSGHGPNDTRKLIEGGFSGGIGKGIMRLFSDYSGNIIGLSWSNYNSSTFKPIDSFPIAIGELLSPTQ